MLLSENPHVAKLFLGTLDRLLNPELVRDAFRAAAQEVGYTDVDEFLPPVTSTPKKKSKGGKALNSDSKPKVQRGYLAYNLFYMLAQDHLNHNPSYARLLKTAGPGDDKQKPTGLSMKIAGRMWKSLSDEQKKSFNDAYQVRNAVNPTETIMNSSFVLHVRLISVNLNVFLIKRVPSSCSLSAKS
jgi:hypothetical protein